MYSSMADALTPVITKAADRFTERYFNKSNDIKTGQGKKKEVVFDYPAWFNTWLVVKGIGGMAINSLYIIAGLFIFILKPNGPRLFLATVSALIIWNTLTAASTLFIEIHWVLFISILPGYIFGTVIDVTLLILVAVTDKSKYYEACRQRFAA